MTTRMLADGDYATAKEWWLEHGHPVIPRDALPKCGVVVEAGAMDGNVPRGTPLAMGWLYLDNSVGVGMLAWMTANPENTAMTSARALRMLAEAVRLVGAEFGYGLVMATVPGGLCRILAKEGYRQASTTAHYHFFSHTHNVATGGIR